MKGQLTKKINDSATIFSDLSRYDVVITSIKKYKGKTTHKWRKFGVEPALSTSVKCIDEIPLSYKRVYA